MTALDIIKRAMRLLGVLPAGESPSATEAADALSAFNLMCLGMLGSDFGRVLRAEESDAGQAVSGGLYSEAELTAPEAANNGDRFGVTGACTVIASEGTIEGAASAVTTDAATWFWRADIADWTRETTVALAEEPIFPTKFHDGLAFLLAVKIATEYGREPSPVVMAEASKAERALRARYRARVVVGADEAVLLLSRQANGASFEL